MNKVILFDVDGVLSLHGTNFSEVYAERSSLDANLLNNFFKDNWKEIVTGKRDVKEAILTHKEVWGVVDAEGVEEVLTMWFESEFDRNEPMLDWLHDQRAEGVGCYIATNQEVHRGAYMRDVMFQGEFDGYFVSGFIGAGKPDAEFFATVLDQLRTTHPDLRQDDIMLIDDDHKNVAGAKDFGIKAIFYENNDQAIKSLEEFLND